MIWLAGKPIRCGRRFPVTRSANSVRTFLCDMQTQRSVRHPRPSSSARERNNRRSTSSAPHLRRATPLYHHRTIDSTTPAAGIAGQNRRVMRGRFTYTVMFRKHRLAAHAPWRSLYWRPDAAARLGSALQAGIRTGVRAASPSPRSKENRPRSWRPNSIQNYSCVTNRRRPRDNRYRKNTLLSLGRISDGTVRCPACRAGTAVP